MKRDLQSLVWGSLESRALFHGPGAAGRPLGQGWRSGIKQRNVTVPLQHCGDGGGARSMSLPRSEEAQGASERQAPPKPPRSSAGLQSLKDSVGVGLGQASPFNWLIFEDVLSRVNAAHMLVDHAQV